MPDIYYNTHSIPPRIQDQEMSFFMDAYVIADKLISSVFIIQC